MQARMRLLVAEDDRAICALIRTQLQMSGYEVYVARDGVEALGQIRVVKPDAMILDINMPRIDGFGVLEQLRQTPGIRLPVLVLTARHDAQDVRRVIGLGARDFLAKPFTDGQLTARVIRLLRAPPPLSDPVASLAPPVLL